MAMASTLLERGELQIPEVSELRAAQWNLSAAVEQRAYAQGGAAVAVEDRSGVGTVNIRAAAARLGVHENTIRNWVDRGLLQAIRLPGSSFRRIRVSDVQRVAHEMAGELRFPAAATGGRDLETHRTAGRYQGRGRQGEAHEGW